MIPALPILFGAAVFHIVAGRAQRIWASAGVATLMVAVLTSLVDLGLPVEMGDVDTALKKTFPAIFPARAPA